MNQDGTPASPQPPIFSGAAPSGPSNSNVPGYFNEAMGDIVIDNPNAKKKKNKLPFIIGGAVLLIVIAVIVVVILLRNNPPSTGSDKVGETNLDLIFDKTTPILVEENGKYGYINPEDGKTIVRAIYKNAERFYGEYAKVQSETEYMIIDRKGEIKLKSTTDDFRYDVKNNIWSAKSDVYTHKMEKINPDKTTASYLGYGYILVIPENEDEKSSYKSGIPYIINAEKKTIYTCEGIGCSAVLVKATDSDDVYAAISTSGKKSKIVSLKDSQTISEADTTSYYAKIGENILALKATKDRAIQKYLTIKGGAAAESKTLPEIKTQVTISDSGKYVRAQCGNGFYSVNDKDGNSIVGCDYTSVVELSANVFAKLAAGKKEPVFLTKDDKVILYDLANKKELASYNSAEVNVSTDSPFFQIVTDNSKSSVCNIFELGDCVSVDTLNVKGFSNYFTANEKYYNYSKKEIR